MSSWFITLFRLGWRNIRRGARRSILTAAAMILGVGLLMLSRALADGGHEDWIEAGARAGAGHLTIQHPDFQLSRKIDDRVPATARRDIEAVLGGPEIATHVLAISPRLIISGLASSPIAARPASIMAVEPALEAEFTLLDEKVVVGRYLESSDELAAYVGLELMERLKLGLGSRLVLTAQDATGEIGGQLVRIVGAFRTGIPEVDQSVVQIPLATAGAWLGTGGDLSAVAVLLDSSFRVENLKRAVEAGLSAETSSGQLAVLSWREAMPALDAGVRIDDYGDYVFHGVLLAIVALTIVNSILMSVMYRSREFGVLQALGFTPRETAALVMIEGSILTAISGVVGVILGLSVTWLLWRDGLDLSSLWNIEASFSGVIIEPIIVPVFRVAHVIMGLVFIGLVGPLASVYPAYRATRIDVANAMKFER